MSIGTNIEWTDATWNPVTGCSRVSAGCDNCYAVQQSHRLEGLGQTHKYGGLTVINGKGDRHFNGTVKCHDDALTIPLKRKKPTTYFVNSMSDLFHAGVPFEFIDRVFAVMALCPQHTFQVLTKRPERMAEYCAVFWGDGKPIAQNLRRLGKWMVTRMLYPAQVGDDREAAKLYNNWPLPNVWLGASVENQEAADLRIPHLLKCPAAVRFLSVEPMLGPVDLGACVGRCHSASYHEKHGPCTCSRDSRIDWVIVGGESGPGARICKIEWVESIVNQCAEAGVACYVKQLGRNVWSDSVKTVQIGTHIGVDFGGKYHLKLRHPKGGDMAEWPAALRVRQFPKGAAHESAIGG